MGGVSVTDHQIFELGKQGEFARALALTEVVLALDPSRIEFMVARGWVLSRAGEAESALLLYGRVARLAPLAKGILLSCGGLAFDAGEFEWAARAFGKHLLTTPEDGWAANRLAEVLLALGRPAEAEALTRRYRGWEEDAEKVELRLERCQSNQRIARAAGDGGLPRGLVVRGGYREGVGYGLAVRQFVTHMVEAGVRVQLVDRMVARHGELDEHLDPALVEATRQTVRARAMLTFTTPLEVEATPGLKTVNFTFFEAARIHRQWLRHSLRHDHALVAVEASRAAWTSAGFPPERIDTCPLGVTPLDRASVVVPQLHHPRFGNFLDRRVRVVNFYDFVDRKNIDALLRVWLATTRPDDDCALLIKAGKNIERLPEFQSHAHGVARAMGATIDQAAPIIMLGGKYSDQQMIELLAAGTHYWSMSHGEGWDLSMTQAGALGLTLLAPRHSAYLDYLDDHTAHLIASERGPAYGQYASFEWWNPDEAQAGRLLRRIIDDPEGTRRSARENLTENFSWRRSTAKLIATLERIGAL